MERITGFDQDVALRNRNIKNSSKILIWLPVAKRKYILQAIKITLCKKNLKIVFDWEKHGQSEKNFLWFPNSFTTL